MFLAVGAILLFYCYGIDYVNGMVIYVTANNLPSNEKERCWDSVEAESKELYEAIYQCSLIDIILESSDVGHALIKHFVIKYIPSKIFCHWLCWVPAFFIVLPCTIKMARRYQKYGCIRNHKNPNNRNHICSVVD